MLQQMPCTGWKMPTRRTCGPYLVLLVFAGVGGAQAEPGQWLWLFADKDAAQDWSAPDVDDASWTPVTLPDSRNPDFRQHKSSYGWYRWHFELPESLTGRELHLDLGHVADLDWTYLNGQLIGSTTDASTAWRTRRYYVAPADVPQAGENVLAVKVNRKRSISGLHDQPTVGFPLAPSDAKWAVSSTGEEQADLSGPNVDDSEWPRVEPGGQIADALLPGWCWFRLTYALPEGVGDLAVELKGIGPYYEAFLNGKPLASAGCLGPVAVTAQPTGTRLTIPPDYRFVNEPNVLALKVYHADAAVTTPRMPILWLDLPGAPVQHAFPPGVDPVAEREVIAALREAGHLEAARERLELLTSHAQEDRRMLGAVAEEAVLLNSAARDNGAALEWFAALVSDTPTQPFDAPVVESVLKAQAEKGALDSRAFFLGEDRATRGDWPGVYGRSAYVLCAMMEYEITGGPEWPLALRFRTADPTQTAKVYIGKSNSGSPTALRDPFRRTRTIAWRDDYGEQYDFQVRGPDLIADLVVPQGKWLLSLYIMDPDWSSTEHPRDLSVVLTQAEDATPLAVARASDLAAGVYFRFLLTGPLPLTIRICKHRSPDANLSGIFLDRMMPLLPVPEMLTDDSSRTQPEAVGEEYAKLCGRLDAEQPDWPAYVAGLQHLQQSLHQTLGTLPNAPQAALQWVSWQTCKHLADWPGARTAAALCVEALVAGRPAAESEAALKGLLNLRMKGGLGPDGSPLLTLCILRALADVGKGEVQLDALQRLAELHVDLIDDATAAEAYRRILELSPDGERAATAHFTLGSFLFQQGEEEQALAEFQQAVQAAPDSTHGRLANLFVDALEASKEEGAATGQQ